MWSPATTTASAPAAAASASTARRATRLPWTSARSARGRDIGPLARTGRRRVRPGSTRSRRRSGPIHSGQATAAGDDVHAGEFARVAGRPPDAGGLPVDDAETAIAQQRPDGVVVEVVD